MRVLGVPAGEKEALTTFFGRINENYHARAARTEYYEKEKVVFKDLPNRFPSVRSRDFRREEGAYRDFDNLYAMYLLYNLGRYSVRINEQTKRLEIEKEKQAMTYGEAAELAETNARSDSRSYRRHLRFLPRGIRIGEAPDNTHLYDYTDGGRADYRP